MRHRIAWNHQNPTFPYAQGDRFSSVIPLKCLLVLVGLSLNSPNTSVAYCTSESPPPPLSLPLQTSLGWSTLPSELNLFIIELLSLEDAKAISVVSRRFRQLAMFKLFKVRPFYPRSKLSPHTNSTPSPQSVKLDGYEVVETFLSRFSLTCRPHIQSLFVSMRPQEVTQKCDCAASQTNLLVILLSTCTMIQSLTLYVYGSPQKHIVPPFARLSHLTSLFIGTVAPEQLIQL